jgi:hypothetical protein
MYESRLGCAPRPVTGVLLDGVGSHQIRLRPTTIAWFERLLDGAHIWGSFDAMVGRYGLRRYRLIVFPPGISAADRRLLRLWRGWPLGGGVLAMLTVMLVGQAFASSETTLAVVVGIYMGITAVLFATTAGVRGGVRTITIISLPETLDATGRQRIADWEALVDLLTRADRLLGMGEISRAQHESLWWHAYDRMAEPARV